MKYKVIINVTESSVQHGKKWDGFKIVEIRSTCKHKDKNEVI